MIRHCLVLVAVLVAVVVAFPKVKRQAAPESYHLPAGAELVVGPIRTTFSCQGQQYGYYADVDNECKIFHVCVPVPSPDDGSITETLQYSFFCGNQTYFDQSQLTCDYPDPDGFTWCGQTNEWRYLNDFFGNLVKQFYPRKAIPDQRPQGSVESAPNVERRN